MLRSTLLSLLALATLVVGGPACTGSTEERAVAPSKARDYFPLAVGNSWVYRTKPAPEGAELDEIKIVSRDAEGFFVDNRGGRLVARATGIFDGDRFLLEEPLETGHHWLAVPSASTVERFEIVETGAKVTVPAGSFSDCVRVAASQEGPTPDGRKVKLQVTWTYAPGVGLVEIVSTAQIDDGAVTEQGRRSLVRFTLVEGAAG